MIVEATKLRLDPENMEGVLHAGGMDEQRLRTLAPEVRLSRDHAQLSSRSVKTAPRRSLLGIGQLAPDAIISRNQLKPLNTAAGLDERVGQLHEPRL
ncbi:MAG: hypothetical protein ACRDSP_03185 [Pseudonocardiaceae bacterium]